MEGNDATGVLDAGDIERLLDVMRELAICSTSGDFRTATARILDEFTAYRSALILIADTSDVINTAQLRNICCPDDFFEIYSNRGFHQQDPLFNSSFEDGRLRYWSGTYSNNPPPRGLCELLAKFGLNDGFAVEAADRKTGTGSILSIGVAGVGRDERTENILKFIMPILHRVMLRIGEMYPRPSVISFTPKELEVLNWLKFGKSSWEIACILGITERTINFHVYNILEKLGVTSRIQAVVAAIQLGVITQG